MDDNATQELQARYDALEAQKAALNPDNSDDKFQITVIENEQQQIKDQLSDADRLQRQAEEVADIQLPEDYDARWGVTGANDEIANLIRQVKEYAFSVHNDEMAEQSDQYRAKLQDLEQQLAVSATMVNQLEADKETLTNRAMTAESAVLRAQDDLKDALSKRDNAVQQKEEAEAERDRLRTQVGSLNSQINELEGMLRTYRGRQGVSNGTGGLVLTSTLKPESDTDRADRVKREKVEQLNRMLERRGITPVQVPPPTSPQQPEEAPEVAAEPEERFPAEVATLATVQGQSTDGAMEGKAEGVADRLAALEARVAVLEQRQTA
ncbi:hypothetical protein GXP70_12385 [Paenibacillus lycopersici]|uniref:Uncharacterized protein n=1 Tax=Paenibacillus lycopersici TaxID=2704462 RepID=A0A6C0FU29_9BACL|nr:hypothetical protein [Paenibacillus lycopersici]QHT60658.1 hypothetical protein GXP70_12385 [Paenibacillus lycopersici]